MTAPFLTTKLFIPPPHPNIVPRLRLQERLNEGLARGSKLMLISASAGFGKTTLVSEWVAALGANPSRSGRALKVAWLSLDEGDHDPARFISYLVKALQTVNTDIGEGLLAALQSPQPLQIATILTSLLNEVSNLSENILLVLDDYHALDSQPVDQALTFILEHQPPQLRLVIATREDPSVPLPRLRARSQLTELRAADLRFTPAEAAEFLNRAMRLNLSPEDIAVLDKRTEGWIAGLQLAALSMLGHQDTAGFIKSFTGSHHFVMDYLVEEVLAQQPENIQAFLLRTSILDQMCGPLCDAILLDPAIPAQATLDHLERANLFIIPLDNERRWYRYHHLFGDLLRKRLGQNLPSEKIAELHLRASAWCEINSLLLEAFRHAAAANDIERAIRLMESQQMPQHLRGTAATMLEWLQTLPEAVLNTHPVLWWKQAALRLEIGQAIGVEEKLQAAEAALQSTHTENRDLIGKISLARATLALNTFEIETILTQSRRALEYLAPGNLGYRSTATLTLGFAHYLNENLDEAEQAYTEALAFARLGGDIANTTLAAFRLAQVQSHRNQLHQAAETYQRILGSISESSPSDAAAALINLADINYEWNNLDDAERYLEQSSKLAQQYEHVVDRLVLNDLYLARVNLARGDPGSAVSILARAEQNARQKNVRIRRLDIAYSQALIYFRQGRLDIVTQLAEQNDLPLMQVRVLIAQGNPAAALDLVQSLFQKVGTSGWPDRLLKVMTVQAIIFHALGERSKALALLDEVFSRTETEGFIRLFLDEGTPMKELLSAAAAQGLRPGYVNKLLAAFAAEPGNKRSEATISGASSQNQLLSPRELEILHLIAEGRSNQEICARLYLALDTVKGHNRRIFEKLQVQRRTEAIARARELGLL